MTAEELAEVLRAVNANRPQVTQTMNFNAPIGQQIAHVDRIEAHFDKDMGMQVVNAEEMNKTEPGADSGKPVGDEELCHFIYPGLDEQESLTVHRQIRDVVRRFGMKDICSFLKRLADEDKVLLPQVPQNAFDELHRMGMPPQDVKGFGYDNFCKYYRK